MAESLNITRDDYFKNIDQLISIAFTNEVGDEFDLHRGPSFEIWSPRSYELNSISKIGYVFNARKSTSRFYFSKRYLTLLAVNNKAISVTSTYKGRPLNAFEIGDISKVNELLRRIDSMFDKRYYARFISSNRGRDALVFTKSSEIIFMPFQEAIKGQLETLNLSQYFSYIDRVVE